jgi:uncharacterized protein YjbJ (UPF0337 family)
VKVFPPAAGPPRPHVRRSGIVLAFSSVSHSAARRERPPVPDAARKEQKVMNWDQIEGQWRGLRGRVRQRWARLSENDLDAVRGRQQELIGRIRERHGATREKAEKEGCEWVNGLTP